MSSTINTFEIKEPFVEIISVTPDRTKQWLINNEIYKYNYSTDYANLVGWRTEKIYKNNRLLKQIEYNNKLKVHEEKWYNYDMSLHRENEPAYILIENDKIIEQRWMLDGYFHRLVGPAYIEQHIVSRKPIKEYWINGEEYDKYIFYKRIRIVKTFINNIRNKIRAKKEISLYVIGFNKDISKLISTFTC